MKLAVNDTYVKHLQRLVQIPTVSSDNDLTTDWAPFEAIHKALEEMYPLIHQHLTKKEIGRGALLFHWKSANPKKKPVLLMGHLDVVPAGDPKQWRFDPYSAAIADGCMWGRGTTDCKSTVLSELEAVEGLLAEGFEPDFDIYLAFGHNEEVNADPDIRGAARIVTYLKDQGIAVGTVFDEGGAVQSGKDKGLPFDIARITMGEKASSDYTLYKDCAGGHSSMPGKGTALGSVAKAVVAVESHPYPYRLTPLAAAQLKAMAPAETGLRRDVFSDPEGRFEELKVIAAEDRAIDAILHTTFAVTMASGSPQNNVLPSHAEVNVNVRILEGDTADSVLAYFKGIIPSDVKAKIAYGEDPWPDCSVDSGEYRLTESVLKGLYGDDLLIVPNLMTGASDARYYSAICRNVFRFSGLFKDSRWGEAHQVDEKIPLDVLATGVQFFQTWLRAYNK